MKPKMILMLVMVAGTAASIAVFIATTLGVKNLSGAIGGAVGGMVAAIMVTMAKRSQGGDED